MPIQTIPCGDVHSVMEHIRQFLFPPETQRCIVHQVRYTKRFVNYKDLKPFVKDLKEVYQASTEELALENLDQLEEK